MIVFCLQDPTVPGEQAHIHVHVLFGLGSAAYHCGETNFFHDCEIKSGSGLGMRLAMSHDPEGQRTGIETTEYPCSQKNISV